MGYIDVDSMYWEMMSTMENNFQGSEEDRFECAKALFLESVADTIDQNREGLVKELKEKFSE